jgi:hypothetical protein
MAGNGGCIRLRKTSKALPRWCLRGPDDGEPLPEPASARRPTVSANPDDCSVAGRPKSSRTDEELHRIEPRAWGLLPYEQIWMAMVKQPDKRALRAVLS